MQLKEKREGNKPASMETGQTMHIIQTYGFVDTCRMFSAGALWQEIAIWNSCILASDIYSFRYYSSGGGFCSSTDAAGPSRISGTHAPFVAI